MTGAAVLSLVLATTGAGQASADAGTDSWQVMELVGLPGYQEPRLADVNERGSTVGNHLDSAGNPVRPARWDVEGNRTDLDTGGASLASAAAVDERDTVVGGVVPGGPARWAPSGQLALLQPVPGYPLGAATDINERGEIVGTVHEPVQYHDTRAIRWDRQGRPTFLEIPPEAQSSAGSFINDDGIVLGWMLLGGVNRAVRWDEHGRLLALDIPPDGARSTVGALGERGDAAGSADNAPARWDRRGHLSRLPGPGELTDIDARGVAVGWSVAESPTRAVRWLPNGRLEVLDSPLGGSAVAMGMNDRGDAVGWTTDTDWTTRATVWDRHGRAHQLDGTPDAVEASAFDITDSRVVTGQVRTGNSRIIPVLWRPRSH